MRAGEDTLRQAIATATDGSARGRLRVELAELLRVRDLPAARAELDSASRESGPTSRWVAAALSLAQALPAPERLAWLRDLNRSDGKPLPAPLMSALAEAQLAANHAQEATATWLSLARDERAPLHHRRAAAKRAARAAARIGPAEIGNATALLADLGVDRRDRRRGRRKEGAGVPEPAPARPSGGIVTPVRRPAGSGPLAALARRARRPRPEPPALFEQALEEARAGHPRRARRLGDQALRAAKPGPELSGRLAALEAVLREAGAVEDALLLRRTHLETLDSDAAPSALLALAAEAASAGFGTLAAAWSSDAGAPVLVASEGEPLPETPADHYRAAQRLLAGGADAEGAPVLAHLRAALSGHAGADAALALAEARIATPADRLELLRAAHAAEHNPARRARLARRLAAALEDDGDALGAVAVLEAVVAEAAVSRMPARGDARGASGRDAEWARAERVRLLRSLGRGRELAAALERDAGALAGDARLEALAELATLLERGGEPEKALEVRRMALAEFPGAPGVLVEARRHLEATGRAAESLALAHAALESNHPNAELTRRVFGAFGKDAKQISAALCRDIVWRVPGNTTMSGEYRGRREVVEFLRRTGLETRGTYGSRLHTVLANDEWGLAVYRAWGSRNGIDLDVDQAFVIRFEDGMWKDVTAVPLDSAFDAFWA